MLAGDAAHQMPQFLGQGMCSGIRDAHALAWRLDLILGGRSGSAILADYVTERAGHVDHIIHGAMFLGSVIQIRNPVVARLRNLFLFRLATMATPLRAAFTRAANRKQPLSGGCFGTNRRKIAGHLMPQPKVRTEDSALVLMDEVLGTGFAVVACKGALGTARAALGTIPLRVIAFAPVAGPGLQPPEGCRSGVSRAAFRSRNAVTGSARAGFQKVQMASGGNTGLFAAPAMGSSVGQAGAGHAHI